MKKFLVVFNWKLNGNKLLVNNIINIIKNIKIYNKYIILSPPIIYINYLSNNIKNIKNVYLCSQNVDFNEEGSYTGEISSKMLKEFNVNYCIIGHSERRLFHNEKENSIVKKIISLKKEKIIPILCIGDNKNEYLNNKSIYSCLNQIKKIIYISKNINILENICIAYEPIWAIGSDKIADFNHINNILNEIKIYINKLNNNLLKNINFLYGGSISESNILNIYNKKIVDGFLIGKSSININSFKKILNLII